MASESTLYTLAETAINALVHGSAYAVTAGTTRADVAVYIALVANTALLSPPHQVTIQVCQHATDDTQWIDGPSFSTNTVTANTTTANGAISAAATSVTLTGSGTFGSRSALLYFRDSSSVGEFVQAQSQATTTLTVPAPGVVNSHLTGINIYDGAVKYYASLDVTDVKRIRLKVDNNVAATGPTIAVFATIEN